MTDNLADLLARAAEQSPDRVALVEPATGRRVTWAELDREVDKVAGGLAELGLVAGYRVLISLANRVELVTVYLAALRSRLVAVPVNPRAATGELVRMLADCGARLVVAGPATAATARAAVAGLQDALVGADEELRARTPVPRIVVVGTQSLPGESTYDELLSEQGTVAAPPPDPEALAVLLYTSGTSGAPRAAMLSHRALVANLEQVAAVQPPMLEPDDVVLGVLPLFHVYGLNAVLGQVLRRQATLLVVDGFDADSTLDLVSQQGVTVLPVAPPVFAHWRGVPDLRERLGSVRLCLSGSAPLPAEAVRAFTDATGIPVHQGYGLTEAAPVVTSTLCSRAPKPGSVGAALPGVALRLVDETGAAPEGEDPGEIQVAGDNLFSGYWPDGEDAPGADGWFATGDVGFLDADGDLFLVDRLKDLVIVSGFNVYPSEVEDVVREVDAVADAAVIGTDDERTGEAVVAYVVRRADSSLTDAEVADAVREHCASRLARFKQPAVVHVVTDLPRSLTGEVSRGRLRERRRRRSTGLLE